MPIKTDKQLWQDILQQAQLNEEEKQWFSLTHQEVKRSILFVRKLQEFDIPDEVTQKVRVAAASMDLRLRITDKWPTMEDLRLAVGDVTFLWQDWIPIGFITLLAGEAKTGKSKLAQWLSKVLINGTRWPDGTLCKDPGNVIYIDAEGSLILAANSASDMDIDLSRMRIPDFNGDMLGQPDLNNEEHKTQFVQMIRDLRPKLVIIDSLGGVKSGGENRKEDMQPTMLFLNHLAQEYQFAVVVIHHLNKTKREEEEEIAINHLRGSTAIVQFARSILFFARKPKGLRLWVGGSNVANFPEIHPLKAIPLYGERQKEDRVERFVLGYEFEEWEEEVKTTKIEECQRWVVTHLSGCELYHNVSTNIFQMGDETWTIRTIKEAGAILERKGIITRSGGKNSIWQLIQLPMGENSHNGHRQRGSALHEGGEDIGNRGTDKEGSGDSILGTWEDGSQTISSSDSEGEE